MFGDFLTLIMDQIVEPGREDPLHVRRQAEGAAWSSATTLGATRRSAAQHSQSLHAWSSHIPGLKVVAAVDAVRREGAAEGRDPRRQPGRHLRGQDDATEVKGPVPDEEYIDPARRRRRQARGQRHHARRDEQHGAGRARRRRDARAQSASAPRWSTRARRGRSTSETLDRVGQEDVALHRHRRGLPAATASRPSSPRSIAEGAFYDLDAPVHAAGARWTCRSRSRRRSRT